jgi:hypothetical protein
MVTFILSTGLQPSVVNILNSVAIAMQSLEISTQDTLFLGNFLDNLQVLLVSQISVESVSEGLKSTLERQVSTILISAYITILCMAACLIFLHTVDKMNFLQKLKKE